MKTQLPLSFITLIFVVLTLNFASALVVDAEYIVLYPGEEGRIEIEVENNFDFDIEKISIALELSDVPFVPISSSEKDIEDLDEDDEDTSTFRIRASTDITPGDYDIPYVVRYTNAENSSIEQEEKNGSFGIRVSARTNIDFSVESKDNIVGQQGTISLKVINQGLGEVKFVSVQIFPNGYELLSADKIYIGNIDSDDSDFATFDVLFGSPTPILSAKVEYKDFDNKAQTETIGLPVKVYTREKALELGLIKNANYVPYVIGGGILVLWYIVRKVKKRRRNKKREGR
ncbi:hypothetical protein CMI44_01395 [Candidatus Pacearchaeota archaeon]|nr:hypothetical protein [Candidatus Pacearchaeota archaeon]